MRSEDFGSRMALVIDWRLPEHRREAFQRLYSFHLRHRAHPGMVYSWLPAIAEHYELDQDGRAWLVWLNGNTQNPVTSLLLLEAAPTSKLWPKAVAYWNDNFKLLEWDTDRRHQKSKFGEATEDWFTEHGHSPAQGWLSASERGWEAAWAYSLGQPHMGRLSAWSQLEYARILLGEAVPDIGSWMLGDKAGSNSHRNALGLLAGHEATYWEPGDADLLGLVPGLGRLADKLLAEARERNPEQPHVGRLTMESALCTWKSWHKPNRRYPGCYADMAYYRLRKAEARFGPRFQLLWDVRKCELPEYLRLEDNLLDPGLGPVKQNHYLLTGQVPVLGHEWPDMWAEFDQGVQEGWYGPRKDPSWSIG